MDQLRAEIRALRTQTVGGIGMRDGHAVSCRYSRGVTSKRAVPLADAAFAIAQSVAAIGAMTWNFILNNVFTYRDQRLSGWRFLTGSLRFQLICAIGAVANVGLAIFIHGSTHIWWLAGLAGVVIGAVWNYAVTSAFVWRPAQR